MKKVLIVHPTGIDRRELQQEPFSSGYKLVFPDYDARTIKRALSKGDAVSIDTNPEAELDALIALGRKERVDGVISTEDYPGPLIASAVARSLGVPGPNIKAVIACQHKWYARCEQAQHVPGVAPRCCLINPHNKQPVVNLPFPFFIKPVKASSSFFAYKIESLEELKSRVASFTVPERFLTALHWYMHAYTDYTCLASQFIAEELLEGVQVTLDGYVFDGQVTVMGITDSVMFPGTLCFKRFEYPSRLPAAVQAYMRDIACAYVTAIGLDMTLFNIEFMYNPASDQVHIIEINARMASQFADLFEKVDGINAYQIALDIAVGKKPSFCRGKGPFSVAASFVLRTFQDSYVASAPTAGDNVALLEHFPDVRTHFFVTAGQKLSDEFQEGKSYRYGWIQLGGHSWDDLYARFEAAQKYIPFSFAPIYSRT